jgi:hypothetical protein
MRLGPGGDPLVYVARRRSWEERARAERRFLRALSLSIREVVAPCLVRGISPQGDAGDVEGRLGSGRHRVQISYDAGLRGGGMNEESGSAVRRVRAGDRVIVPFAISCGSCFSCARDLPGHRERSNPERYGPDGGVLREKGGGLFVYTGRVERSSPTSKYIVDPFIDLLPGDLVVEVNVVDVAHIGDHLHGDAL